MTDIVERLRKRHERYYAKDFRSRDESWRVLADYEAERKEAADEIGRLRVEVSYWKAKAHD